MESASDSTVRNSPGTFRLVRCFALVAFSLAALIIPHAGRVPEQGIFEELAENGTSERRVPAAFLAGDGNAEKSLEAAPATGNRVSGKRGQPPTGSSSGGASGSVLPAVTAFSVMGMLEIEGLIPELDSLNRESKLAEFLEAELELLTRIRKSQKVVQRAVARLWVTRGVRRRAVRDLKTAILRHKAHSAKTERRKELLARQYRALYKLADRSVERSLLNPENLKVPHDGRVEFTRLLARKGEELGVEQAVSRELERQVQTCRDTLSTLKLKVAELDRRRDALSAHRERLWQLLSDVRRRKEKRNRNREVFDREIRRLNGTVADLELTVRRESRSFASLKGRLPRPVPGLLMEHSFGERNLPGTQVTEKRLGVEISALKGWRARSPAAGSVQFAGNVPGYRRVVMIDHGEGFLSVVGYLKNLRVQPGQPVRPGHVLGEVVGAPQRRRGQPRTCYFELRRGSIPLNPNRWLKGGRRSPGSKRRAPSRRATRPQTQVAGRQP